MTADQPDTAHIEKVIKESSREALAAFRPLVGSGETASQLRRALAALLDDPTCGCGSGEHVIHNAARSWLRLLEGEEQ